MMEGMGEMTKDAKGWLDFYEHMAEKMIDDAEHYWAVGDITNATGCEKAAEQYREALREQRIVCRNTVVTRRDTWVDTPQQKACLRQNKTARMVRARYPQGTRVHVRVSDKRGTGKTVAWSVLGGSVYRHVPGANAQGGDVVVDWDNGVRGRMSPCNLVVEETS